MRAICARGAAALSRAQIDELTEVAKASGAKGMAYVYVEEGRALRGPIVKFLSEAEQRALVERTQAEPGDLIVFAADAPAVAAAVLGALRSEFIVRLEPQPSADWAAAWVIEFPLFEIDAESEQLTYGHNPFSLPTDATIGLLESDPLAVRGAQYDLVLNGFELGSGSLRNHRPRCRPPCCAPSGSATSASRSRSASSSRRWSTARRRTAASASASTASSCCSPANRASATSSPSPRRPPGSDPMTGAPASVGAGPAAGPAPAHLRSRAGSLQAAPAAAHSTAQRMAGLGALKENTVSAD